MDSQLSDHSVRAEMPPPLRVMRMRQALKGRARYSVVKSKVGSEDMLVSILRTLL